MHRLACIELRAFPLQLLLQKHPDWKGYPVAVVAEDRAQAKLVWVNEAARKQGICVGQTHSHALSLTGQLRAGVVDIEQVAIAVRSIVDILGRFSPEVEPCEEIPGVFWCNASGLGRLFKSLPIWGRSMARALRDEGWWACTVVGFRRFGCYALARSTPVKPRVSVRVIADLAEEERSTKSVLLRELDLAPSLREKLCQLGIVTLGEFAALPAHALGARFGQEALVLHGLATGTSWDPLRPEAIRVPCTAQVHLEPAEINRDRLIFAIKRALDGMLSALAVQRRAVTVLFVDCVFAYADRQGNTHTLEIIRPATATLQSRVLLSLLQLRLESSKPLQAVSEVHLSVEEELASRVQLSLFVEKPKRDLLAANEALARIRADLGNDAIVVAEIRSGHLPAAQYCFQVVQTMVFPVLATVPPTKTLVRRIFHRPKQLSSMREMEMVHRIPHVISGGWWNRAVHREYCYVRDKHGDLLWVYFDRVRNRWMLQGRVE